VHDSHAGEGRSRPHARWGERRRGERARAGRAGYEEGRRLSFWVSFDPDAQTVKYGKGHHMEARPCARSSE